MWESGPEWSGKLLRKLLWELLCKLLLQERKLQSLLEDVVRKLLQSFDWGFLFNKSTDGQRQVQKRHSGDELGFRVGKNCDNLITPFQCDLCYSCNMTGRDPAWLVQMTGKLSSLCGEPT